MSYPKPAGWNGGPDGRMLRQGLNGHLGYNPSTDAGEKFAQEQADEGEWDRCNEVGPDALGGI